MGHLTVLGWTHLIFFGVLVPALVLRTKRRIDAGALLPPFRRHIAFASANLMVLAGISLLAARFERIEVFPWQLPALRAWLLGAALYGAAVAIMAPQWRRTLERRDRVLRLFTPRSRGDRAIWVAASAIAGVSEEITWRGVQFALLWTLTGSPVAAAAACAIMFGLAHMVQGPAASAAVVLFALAFQGLVYYSGSLYVAMAVHFAYDVTAGLTYGRLWKPPDGPRAAARPDESSISAEAPDAGADPGSRS